MSERVLPDRYGYWIAKTVLGNEVVFRVFGGQGIPAVYADIRGGVHPVERFNGEWIASVADTQERLAAAEAELEGYRRAHNQIAIHISIDESSTDEANAKAIEDAMALSPCGLANVVSDLVSDHKCSVADLAAMTKHRDELQALCDHLRECERHRCSEVVTLQGELRALKERIEAAPVAWAVLNGLGKPVTISYGDGPFAAATSHDSRVVKVRLLEEPADA